MNRNNTGLRDFYLLWVTQSMSQLGSTMTGFALTLWLYEKTGSALSTAMLTICTYLPYVLMSIAIHLPRPVRCWFLCCTKRICFVCGTCMPSMGFPA